jgi:hypothetical protein
MEMSFSIVAPASFSHNDSQILNLEPLRYGPGKREIRDAKPSSGVEQTVNMMAVFLHAAKNPQLLDFEVQLYS